MTTAAEIPKKMKAWMQKEAVPHEKLKDASYIAAACSLTKVDVPELEEGQLLVRVNRGTINPNDLLHIRNEYVLSDVVKMPRPLGFEGAGTVVASKQGSWIKSVMMPKVGTRIAFYKETGGMFGQYVTIDAMKAIPIPDEVEFSTAACSVSNPLTAILMVDQVKAMGHKIFVNTAAASALGRLLIRYAHSVNVDVICVIRREEQAEICRAEGATRIVNSSDSDFEERLAAVMKETGCSYCCDAVAGTMTRSLLKASPRGSIVSVYGSLSGQDITIGSELVPNKEVHVFTVPHVLDRMWKISLLMVIRKLSNGMGKIFTSKVQKEFKLDQLPDAYAFYASNMTGGKVQIVADTE